MECCPSEQESYRKTKDIVAAARCEYLSVIVRDYVACGLVDSGVEGDVQEYTAYLYSQTEFPVVVLIVENLLEIIVFEMLEILLCER